MRDPLEFIWPAVEAIRPTFSRAAVIRWPTNVQSALINSGLLVCEGTTRNILCPECGQVHITSPMRREQPDGKVRVFIPCAANVRAEIKTHHIQQWGVCVEKLVTSIAYTLSLSGKPAKLESDRVWRCGRWMHHGELRDILFARGLRRNDAVLFRRAITRSRSPIIFVGSEVPEPDFWEGNAPPIIALREVATLAIDQIKIDITTVIDFIRTADQLKNSKGLAGKKMQGTAIRRAVRDEIKSLVKDDNLVAAYKKYGSYDKAVAGLDKEGVKTNRTAVARAVKKERQQDDLIRNSDSESIVRSTSSKRRDMPH